MTPTPTALGMTLCDYLIVEEGTRRVSLINCFTALSASSFPVSRPFFIFADLTDGSGTGVVELVIVRSETDEEIHRQAKPIRFVDRLRVVQYGWKVMNCSFPAPGRYIVNLLVDGEWVAQRILDLVMTGGSL